jgi:IS5 family transposase
VNTKSKLIHTVLVSGANVADALALPHLPHGNETRGWGDQAYRGQKQAMHAVAPRARDFTISYRLGSRIDERLKATNRTKSQLRAKFELHNRGDQAGARLPEGPLPWTGQEAAPPAGHGGTC